MKAFAQDASHLLSERVDAGAKVPFEVDEQRCGGSVLYRYQALTDEFIDRNWDDLKKLRSYGLALAALNCDEKLVCSFLKRIWADTSNFELYEERFNFAFAEMQLKGVELESEDDDSGVLISGSDLAILRNIASKLKQADPTLFDSYASLLSDGLLDALDLDSGVEPETISDHFAPAEVADPRDRTELDHVDWSDCDPALLEPEQGPLAPVVSSNGQAAQEEIYDDPEDYSAPA